MVRHRFSAEDFHRMGEAGILPARGAYRNRLPEGKDTLMVIEVAESSLDYDLRVKVPLYARSGVPEVWAVDLARDRLQHSLEPQGGAYLRQEVLEEGLVEVFGLSFPLKEVLP